MRLGGNGKEFINNHGIKGCHAEGAFSYYGIEENKKNAHRYPLVAPFYRPNGYDCGITKNIKLLVNYRNLLRCC